MAAAVLEAFDAMSYILKKRLIVPLLMDKLIVTQCTKWYQNKRIIISCILVVEF